MIDALAGLDPIRAAQIVVKALSYATVMLAAGSALFLAAHRDLDAGVARFTRRIAAAAAAAGLALAGATLAGEALFLAGGDLAVATDADLLAVVLEAPFADAQALRALGYGLVGALAAGSAATPVAVAGAAALAASFALAGHAAAEPRAALAALIMVHILGVSYWLGAFAPLARLARVAAPAEAGRVSEAFGRNAVVAVGLLIVAGVALLLLIAPDPAALPGRPYGAFLGVKLAMVTALMALGALNKLALSPALAAGRAEAAGALRRSIAAEAGLAAAILAATAAMTLLTSP
jgi:putative copper resistance protein D